MMDRSLSTDNWLILESEDEQSAEYADFAEQAELDPSDAVSHREFVRRVADEFGFALTRWTPAIPRRAGSRR